MGISQKIAPVPAAKDTGFPIRTLVEKWYNVGWKSVLFIRCGKL